MENDEPSTAGWDAISATFDRIYPGQTPLHWGPVIHARIGGPDPLDGVSIYRRDGEQPYWHYVSYGMSDLYDKEGADPELSGCGFEFTLRLKRSASAESPPEWPISFFNNLARYVFSSGKFFEPGHRMNLNGPIALGEETAIAAVLFAEDPEAQTIETPNGRVQFIQIVGTTLDEWVAVQKWTSEGFLKLFSGANPLLITDLDRDSYLSDPQFASTVREGIEREGSSTGALYVQHLEWTQLPEGHVKLTIGATGIRMFPEIIVGRIPFGRGLLLSSQTANVQFRRAEQFRVRLRRGDLELHVTSQEARDIAAVLKPIRGTYRFDSLPLLTIEVVPSNIKDSEGRVVEVVG